MQDHVTQVLKKHLSFSMSCC